MQFLSIPVINLRRRLLRTVLTLVGISVAVGSFITLVGMSRALENAWINSLNDRGTHVVATSKGVVELLTGSIYEKVGDDIRKVCGVNNVAGELVDMVQLKSGKTVLITGWEPDSYLWKKLRIEKGRLPDMENPIEIAMGHACAETLALTPGDSISIRNNEFIVSGIFKQSGIMTNGTIVFKLPVMQRLMGKTGLVTLFNIVLNDPHDSKRVSDTLGKLSSKFDTMMFSETDEITDNNQMIKLFRAMAWGTSSVALVIALVVILNTLLMTVIEQTREIGILSSVGWSRKRILSMIILEGLLLSLIGSIAGSIAGILSLNLLSHLPQMQGFLETQVTFRMLTEISIATCLLGILGGIYPAYRAVNINVVDALRYE